MLLKCVNLYNIKEKATQKTKTKATTKHKFNFAFCETLLYGQQWSLLCIQPKHYIKKTLVNYSKRGIGKKREISNEENTKGNKIKEFHIKDPMHGVSTIQNELANFLFQIDWEDRRLEEVTNYGKYQMETW